MAKLELNRLSKGCGGTEVIKGLELPNEHSKSTPLQRSAWLEQIIGGLPWISDRMVNNVEPCNRGTAIGGGILRHPEVSLSDEPLSNPNADLRVEMGTERSRLHNELDATMTSVSHDQIAELTLADKIVVMDGGTVQQVDSPLKPNQRPANLFVAGFIDSAKTHFVKVAVVSPSPNATTVNGKDAADLSVQATCSTSGAAHRTTFSFPFEGARPARIRSLGRARGVVRTDARPNDLKSGAWAQTLH